MAILSWGKCDIKHKGGSYTDFTSIDTPKDGTTKLTSNAGAETTATEEGGAVVDYRRAKATYTFEFDLFRKKGGTPFLTDDDGVVDGEHAFQVIPEDVSCDGLQMDRTVVSKETSYSTAEGIIDHYVAKVLRPVDGSASVKPVKGTNGQNV